MTIDPRASDPTRRIFDRIHRDQAEDPQLYQRLVSLLSTEYLQLPPDYFASKTCLDTGCGSNANATRAMLELGAGSVVALDLDESIASAARHLASYTNRHALIAGDVLALPLRSASFDFVCCNGVLHHTTDAREGFRELARVTKPGGILYIVVDGPAGLAGDMVNLLRSRYAADEGFRSRIDQLTFETLRSHVDWILDRLASHERRPPTPAERDFVLSLFDKELVLTLKDRIQAPRYDTFREEEVRGWFEADGFTDVTRLTRYPAYSNVRRFLAPLYCYYDHPLAALVYGEGVLQLRATRIR